MMVVLVIAAWCLLAVLFERMKESKARPIRWTGKVLGFLLVAVVAGPFVLAIVAGIMGTGFWIFDLIR